MDAPRLAASCFNPTWIELAAHALGSPSARALAEDVALLARAASTEKVLARLNALAWIFVDAADAERAADRELTALGADEVASADALAIAAPAGPIAEVLRAAAELELPHLAAIGTAVSDSELEAIGRTIDEVLPAAPSLAAFAIAVARPLGLRGRALGASIVVGAPGIACPDAAHAAWQAAHEATVSEVARSQALPFLELERRALSLLGSRARAAGLGDEHARWLTRLDLGAVGPIPDVANTPE